MTTPYTTGTISLTNGSAVVTGIGTAWQIALIKGGIVYPEAAGNGLPIATVDSDTQITAAVDWTGATGTYSYALVRDTAYDAQIAQNAEALARLLAGLEAGTIWKYDMSGDTAGRDIYDGKPKGFSYLDVSVVPAQLWVKASNTEGDWAGPHSYGQGAQGETGPAGPAANVVFEEPETGLPGTDVEMDVTGAGTTGDPYHVTFTIPRGDPGQDGTGTGDVVGPAGATNGHLAVFDGPTGKVLKDGGAPFSGAYADLSGKPTLGGAAALNVGTTAGTVAAGDDARFSAGGSSKNEAIFALEIADLKGGRLGMVGGIADAFDDETGVNVGGSTNQSYDAVNDWYIPSAPGSVRLTGATPTTPLGGTPANINDNNAATTSAWAGGNLTSVTDINNRIIARLDFGTVRAMTRIEVKALRFSSGSATNYLALYYSSDGATWTKLGGDLSVNTTPTDFAMDGTFNARYVAMIAGQFNISVTVTIGDLNAYGPGTPLNMTLVSIPYTASAAPSNGRLALQTVESETIAINTDLTIEMSRNDGTTYTAATLALSTNIGTAKMYEGVVDLSSQPSGTAMRWRVKTLNGKTVAISGVVMQWS